jgi:hypothetical protein
MLRSISIRAAGIAAVALALSFGLASPAKAANKKHHLTIGLGYQKFLMSDNLPSIDADPGPGVDIRTFDFSGAGAAFFAYRLSLKQNLDLTFDDRIAISTVENSDFTFATDYFGPGLRWISPKEGIRPYLQANFLIVSENLQMDLGDDTTLNRRKSGAGFGASGGIDIRAGNLLSIPVEAYYVYGKPDHDVSGWGITADLTFNFGDLK